MRVHWGGGERPLAIAMGDATCAHAVEGRLYCNCGDGGWERTENVMLVGAASTPIDPGGTLEVEGWMVTNVSSTNVRFLETCRAGIAPGGIYSTFLSTAP